MKKIICVILALAILVLPLCACSDDGKSVRMDALVDYYESRMGYEMPENCIDYVGENEENGYYEYRIENADEGVSETLFVGVDGVAYTIYNEEGTRIHIYNGNNSAEE